MAYLGLAASPFPGVRKEVAISVAHTVFSLIDGHAYLFFDPPLECASTRECLPILRSPPHQCPSIRACQSIFLFFLFSYFHVVVALTGQVVGGV